MPPDEVSALATLAGSYTIVGSPEAEKRALARAQSYNYITGGICGVLVLVLPHPPGWEEAALWPLGPLAVIAGLVLYRYADRWPAWLPATMPALGTVMTSAAVAFTDSAVSPFAILYLWVGFYAFYFLSRPVAIAQVAFIALNYAAIWLFVGTPDVGAPHELAEDVPYLVIAAATIVMSGVLFYVVRRRLGVLVGNLAEAAQTDLLTGLANSRSFRRTLTAEVERAKPARRSVSVLVGDVDRLKKLNQALGHDGADRLLRAIGDTILSYCRPIDTVARVGPGTFAVILPESDEHEALIAAEELLTAVRRGFRAKNRPTVTMSIGVASFPKDAGNVAALLQNGDRALGAAKLLGRDRAVVASPKLDEILSGGPRPNIDESLAHLKTLLSLAEALDMRDPRAASHSRAVGELSERIARELGLSEPRVVRIRLAGILHDIGKVGVPDAVLFSEGPLDQEDWKQMKRHPEIGARILGSSELADIREWVLASHERPDGTGYPRGLRGDEIPIEARIVGVADAYEAMTSDRRHRKALGDPEARRELQRAACHRFDRDVVDALFAVLGCHGVPAKSMQ